MVNLKNSQLNKPTSSIFVLIFQILSELLISLVKCFLPANHKNVSGKLVVITGAGHGLGRELAKLFSGLASDLALIDINEEGLVETRKQLQRSFPLSRVEIFKCDLSDEKQVSSTFDELGKRFQERPVDILINNAGVTNCKRLNQTSPESIKRLFAVNTLSVFWTSKQVIEKMQEQGRGHIVNISSIAGMVGNAFLTDYCASKFALIGFAEALRIELRLDGFDDIKVTTICPLAMNTGMFKKPKSRFELLFPICDVSYVARKTVDAILQEQETVTVPGYAILLAKFQPLMPSKVRNLLLDFFDYRVGSHLD